ncbi:MAG: cupin domain-containing protein [Myxococcota bacterium]
MPRRHPNVVHPSEVEPNAFPNLGGFRNVHRVLGGPAGGRELGCTLYEVEAGYVAWPHHWHTANEEALIVVEGEGVLRLGDAEVEVGPGDYVALPAGPAHAHQLRATVPMRYYCVSTRRTPEVVSYPDSGKVAVRASIDGSTVLQGIFAEEAELGYFDREPLAARDG